MYHFGNLGASNPELKAAAFEMWGDLFDAFALIGDEPEKPGAVRLWDAARLVLGHDIPNVAQETGDCTSWSAKHCVDYLQTFQISIGERLEYHSTLAPYFYGCSRVLIGGGRIWGEGSLGSWTSAAAKQYGCLREDFEGAPPYSGSIAKAWGKTGPPAPFRDEGEAHPVKSVALVTTPEDAAKAIKNGYPVSVCSNVGYSMTPASNGFNTRGPRWDHAMAFTGVSDGADGHPPWFALLNSWGPDAHGQILDFATKDKWPPGMMRITWEDAGRMLGQEDSYIYSDVEGFPAKPLPRELFDPF